MRTRALLLVWLALAGWSSALHFRAASDPPAGAAFVGSFHFVDDVYNYLSYAQQAEDGAFFFRNKLLPPADARPLLVNLEWWLSGRLASLLGWSPTAAFRLLGAIALFGLLFACRGWLELLGVGGRGLAPGLGLVAFGGGLGGLLFQWSDLPVRRCLDVSIAFFPFFEALANPHFVAGTALLCGALLAFARPGWRGAWLGVLLGTALGLVRPYDLAVLGAARLVAVVATRPVRDAVRELLPLAGLLPVLAHAMWLFFGSDQFTLFQRGASLPVPVDYLPALGPALLLAAWGSRRAGAATPGARAHLWAWFACAFGAGLWGGSFSVQFFMGCGTPLLLLGGSGLATLAPSRAALVATAFATSAVVATRVALMPDPNWFVPRERLAAAAALRETCDPRGRLLAPPDISLYALGLSSCHVYVAHSAVADYGRRVEELRRFYLATDPAGRAAFLDAHGISHLVLPGAPGERPGGWLGAATPFRRVREVGAGAATITVYARD